MATLKMYLFLEWERDLRPRGRSWAVLGALLVVLGALLAGLEAIVGRSWPLLGRSWLLLGLIWSHLAATGASWGALGPVQVHPGGPWGRSRALPGAQGVREKGAKLHHSAQGPGTLARLYVYIHTYS